jgi:flavin-binding protein dodecin
VRTPAGGYRPNMSDQTYAITHVVGTSAAGIDQAIKNGISTVSATIRNLDWFEVEEIRGHLADGAVDHFQVTMKVGFRYDD